MQDRIALSGHAFRHLHPDEFLRRLTQGYGLHAIDFWPWNAGGLSIASFREALERCDSTVVCVNAPGAKGRIGHADDGVKGGEAIRVAIGQAAELDAPFVQFYTGVYDWGDEWTTVKSAAAELMPLVDEAQSRGVTLLLENNLDQRQEDPKGLNPSRRPEVVLALLEAVGSDRLKLCYDPANFYMAGAEAFPYAYELLKPHIAHVHVKDCFRYSRVLHGADADGRKLFVDGREGPFIAAAPGDGALNWEGILARLREDAYKGWIVIDPFSLPAQLDDVVRRSVDYLMRRR